MNLEWSVRKSPEDGLYYVRCYNETGGMELTTWYGYDRKENAVKAFHSAFNFPVYDHETKKTIEVDGS